MIPKNWNKVPLDRFVHYLEYIDEEPETIEERFDLLYKRTCAILDCTVEEARKLSIEDQKKLTKLFNTPMPTLLPLSFKHNGKRYRPIIKIKELSGAKYTAIKNAAKRGTKDNLHQILYLACDEYRFGFKKKFPFIGNYRVEPNEEEVEQGIKDFKTLPMEVANPISIFFLTLSKKLNNLLSDYSTEIMKKMIVEMSELQASLEADMDGSQ